MTDSSPLTPSAGDGLEALIGALDADSVQRLRELDPQGAHGLLQRVMQTFVDSLVRHEHEVEQAMAGGDRTLLRHVAHTLKSSAGSVGALDLARACADLEAHLRQAGEGADASALEPLVAAVVAPMRRLLALAGRGRAA